jgi:tetratricopeptide (TPR) repeat protein
MTPPRSLVLATALLGLGIVACSFITTADAAPPLDAGRRAMHRGDLREAIRHFRAAVAASPDHARAHSHLAAVAEILGEFDEALTAYQAAARLGPGPRAHHELGALAARMDEHELAVAAFEASLATPLSSRLREPSLEAVATWADCFAHSRSLLGCGVTAAGLAVAAVRRYPTAAAEDLLHLLVDAGRRDAAVAFAARQGWLRDGADYCATPPEATTRETAALLALLIHPERADCLLEIGRSLTDDGLTRLARRVLLEGAARSPRAEVRDAAAAFLRHRLPAHDVAKRAESLNIIAYRLQHHHRMVDEALVVYQRAIAADPRFSWPYANIGRLLMLRDEHEQAAAWLRRAVSVNPNHWRAQYNLGATAYRLERWQEAVEATRRAVELNPDDADGHAQLGWLYVRLQRDGDAVRELATAVRLDPRLERERRYLDARAGKLSR